ncbi:MAG: hypothetical protein WCK47_13695 [bacterium]
MDDTYPLELLERIRDPNAPDIRGLAETPGWLGLSSAHDATALLIIWGPPRCYRQRALLRRVALTLDVTTDEAARLIADIGVALMRE